MKTRHLIESANFGIGTWSTGDDLFDVWVVDGDARKRESWRWNTADDRQEVVRDLSRLRKRARFFEELSKHASRVKGPAKMKFDGPRCSDCGTSVARGAHRCPSCDSVIDWDLTSQYARTS